MIEKTSFGWIDYYWNIEGFPIGISENIEKTGRPKYFQINFNVSNVTDVAALAQLLYELQNEVFKYRRYFISNNIDYLKILYGDD